MEFNVFNHQLSVGNIKVIGVASSSLLLVGDVQTIQLSSAYDTPPTSYNIYPSVILPSRRLPDVSKNI